VSRVTDMVSMFEKASSFKQTLCGKWKIARAKKDRMFLSSPGKLCDWHLAPAGAHICDFGNPTPKDQCDYAVATLAKAAGKKTTKRPLVVPMGVGSCGDGGRGDVPVGCSAQSGGDWAAHYKETGVSGKGCHSNIYQLVCANG